mgnify:CR=1 FL=1
MIRKQDILGCFFLLSICVVVSLGVNALSRNGIALRGQWNPDKGVVMAGANKAHAVDVMQVNNPPLKGGTPRVLWSSVWLLVRDFVMRGAGGLSFQAVRAARKTN